jgi:hypothetical protein
MQFSARLTACTDAAALNWDVYEPVTKDGTSDTCDSTSAGSDSEHGDHASSASDETHTDVETIPFYGELCSAMAMVWLMGAMNYQAPVNAQPFSKHRRQRVPRGRPGCIPPQPAPPVVAPVFTPPPGLPLPDAPPGLEFSFPPGLGLGAPKRIVSTEPPPPAIKEREGPFEIKAFRKELVATLRELSVLRNVSRAVRRVRAQNVPAEYQAAEFADLLTRAAEEPRGGTRRLWWAFAAGLGAGIHAPDGSAFSMAECQAGLKIFFQDTYPGLCEEIHRLPVAAKAELVPTLQYVFPKEVLPAELR